MTAFPPTNTANYVCWNAQPSWRYHSLRFNLSLRGSWQPVGPLATRAPKNHYLSEMLACYKARVKPEKKKGGRKTERERWRERQSRECRDVIGDQRFCLSRGPLCIVNSWWPDLKWFQCVSGWRKEEIKPWNNFIMQTPCFPCTLRNRMLQFTPIDNVKPYEIG